MSDQSQEMDWGKVADYLFLQAKASSEAFDSISKMSGYHDLAMLHRNQSGIYFTLSAAIRAGLSINNT
jgi:hypothetical protein